MKALRGIAASVLGLLLISVLATAARADIDVQGGDIGSPNEFQWTWCTKANWSYGTCNNLLGAGTHVLGLKLININANSGMSIWNATTVPATGTTGLVDEITEATALDGAVHIWPAPILFGTGVCGSCTGITAHTDNSACGVASK